MFRSFIEVQLAHEHITQLVLREHPANSILNDLEWSLLELIFQRGELQMTGVTAVLEIELVMELGTRSLNLSGIDHDDMVTHVHVRAVMNLQLTSKDIGNTGREVTKDMLLGINDKPLSVLRMNFGRCRSFHNNKID